MKNKPYVKNYETKMMGGLEVEVLTNPITKDKPYLHRNVSVATERRLAKNSNNNKKGIRVVISKLGPGQFVKNYVKTQLIKIGHRRFKQILHYKPAY